MQLSLVTFTLADQGGISIAVNPLHVMAVRRYQDKTGGQPATCRLDLSDWHHNHPAGDNGVLVEGSLQEVTAKLNQPLAAAVSITNDGDCAIIVEARGDNPDLDPPVLEPGKTRRITVVGELQVDVACERDRV